MSYSMYLRVVCFVTLATIVVSNIAPSTSPQVKELSRASRRAQSSVMSRIRRSPFDMIDRSFDAMKCTLKILSTEMSQYHSNRMMCCSLWEIKSFLKNSAQGSCEKPDQILQVFDQFINEELIYSPISKSLLGNQNLSCSKYYEGSASCARLMFFIKFALFCIVVGLLGLIIGFFYFCVKFMKLRRETDRLYAEVILKTDTSSTSSSVENNNSTKRPLYKKSNEALYLRARGDFNLPLPKNKLVNGSSTSNIKTAPSSSDVNFESKV